MSTYKKFTFQGELTQEQITFFHPFPAHRRRQPPPGNVHTDDRRQVPTETCQKHNTVVSAPVAIGWQ
ncbi:hypothetical protein KK078_28735 [Fulvivirgaceae bacterium PWU37]|uniref:Uncharacterized protein n=1 Tax=Dawidia soli TaxID=2782352 RepID=A0AAP2DE93_9BACT|nr:hypothetical protein [Dawidia soli]